MYNIRPIVNIFIANVVLMLCCSASRCCLTVWLIRLNRILICLACSCSIIRITCVDYCVFSCCCFDFMLFMLKLLILKIWLLMFGENTENNQNYLFLIQTHRVNSSSTSWRISLPILLLTETLFFFVFFLSFMK